MLSRAAMWERVAEPPVSPAFRPCAAAGFGSARLCPARGAIRPNVRVRFSVASSRSTDRIRSAERGILSASARARAAGRKLAEAESAATAFLSSLQVDDGFRRLSPYSANPSAAPLHQSANSSADSLALRVLVARSADTALLKDMLWKSAVTVSAPSGAVAGGICGQWHAAGLRQGVARGTSPRSQNKPAMMPRASSVTDSRMCSSGACCEQPG
jgi:hypothetical protein